MMDADGNKERLPDNGKERSVKSSTESATSENTLSAEETTCTDISSGSSTPAVQLQDSIASMAEPQTAEINAQPYANQESSSNVGQNPCPPLADEHPTSTTSLPTFVAERTTIATPQSTYVVDTYTPTDRVYVVFEPVTNDESNSAQDLSRVLYTLLRNPDGTIVPCAVNMNKDSIVNSFQSRDSSNGAAGESSSTSAEGGIFTETNNASSEQGLPSDLSASNSTTADPTQTVEQHMSFIHFSPIPLENPSTSSTAFPQNSTFSNASDGALSDPACTNDSSSVADGNKYETQCTDPVPPASSGRPVYPEPGEKLTLVADDSYKYDYKEKYYHRVQPKQYVVPQQIKCPPKSKFELRTCPQDPKTVFVEQLSNAQKQEVNYSSHLEEQVLSSPDSSCQYQTAESTFSEEQASSSLDSSLCQYQTAESTFSEEQPLPSPDSSLNLHQATESEVLEKDASSSENVNSREFFPEQPSLLQSNALGNAQTLKFEREKHRNCNLPSAERCDTNSSISESNLTDVLSLANSLNDISSRGALPVEMNTTAEQTQATVDSGAALDSPDQKRISRGKGDTSKTAPEFLMEDHTLNAQTSEERKHSNPTEKDVQIEETKKNLGITTELAKTHLRDDKDLEKLSVISPLKESEVASGPDVSSDNPTLVGASNRINLTNTNSISTKKESDMKNDPNIRKKSSKSAKRAVRKAAGGAEAGSKAAGGAEAAGSKAAGGAEAAGSKAAGGAEAGSKAAGGAEGGSKAAGGAQDSIKAIRTVHVQNALKQLKHALIAGTILNICPNAKIANTNDLKYEPEVPNVLKKKTETLLKDVQSANNVSRLKPSPPRHESKGNANSKTSKRQTKRDRRTREEGNKVPNPQSNKSNLPEVSIKMGTSVYRPAANKPTNLGKNWRVEVMDANTKKGMALIMFSKHATTSSMSARVPITSGKMGQPTQKLPDAAQKKCAIYYRYLLGYRIATIYSTAQGKVDSAEPAEKESQLLKKTKDNESVKEDPELEPVSAPSTSQKKKRRKIKKK